MLYILPASEHSSASFQVAGVQLASVNLENENILYEPDEKPPPLVTLGAGVQSAAIMVTRVVVTVVIVARIAEQPESYISWGVFAALVVSGLITALQAVKVGRVGAGHVLIMGTSGAYIAVCATALSEAGPSTMASLIIVSSLFQILLASRLSLLRRIFTPVVSGTVIMLIAVTIMPVMFDILEEVPEGASRGAAPIAVGATILVVAGLVLRGPPAWRLWSPVIGIMAGCLAGAPFGIYDVGQILDAPWVGVPKGSWPGIDLTPGTEFWALLPAFVLFTVVSSIETIGNSVAIQRVSQRRPRATDFRVVQGALNADGVGKFLSGLAGTLPSTPYGTSVAIAEVTGVSARRVGVVIGVIFVAAAFLPKFMALLIAIPSPVAAGFLMVLIGLLFVQGMRVIIQDGVDHRKAVLVGMSFWLGAGFQNGWIFPELLGEGFLGILLGNGMTGGALIAIIMMVFLELTSTRRKRLRIALDIESLPKLKDFLGKFATKAEWDSESMQRLTLVGEETLTSLLSAEGDDVDRDKPHRLSVSARVTEAGLELEFVSTVGEENLEDRLAYAGESVEITDTREISFRLLRHYASSVRHQKYHGVDIVTVQVDKTR